MDEEVQVVSEKKVICEESTGGIGHPRVYLHIGEGDMVQCPYCSKIFTYQQSDQD